MLMKITPTSDGLRIEGELDTSTAPQLREAMGEALEDRRGEGELVLDVSRLSFMDSSGLHVLMEAVASRNGAGPIVLHRPSRAVKRLLEIVLPEGVHGLEVRR
jgi:anti-sigma B factor antagonist